MDTEISDRDIEVLRKLRASPNGYSWKWAFKSGTGLKVEIVGRWDASEAEQAKIILSLIGDIIALGVDPLPATGAPST